MIRFEYSYGPDTTKVVMELPPDSSLSDVIEAFERFLRAATYSFDGELVIEHVAHEEKM